MRRSRIWAAGLAVMVALGFPPPASAGGGSFVIANTASSLTEPVPRGALLSLFTDTPVSPETGRFLPWVTSTEGGLFVQATCTTLRMMQLPIVGISDTERGQKVDVYYPNAMGDEPFGHCDDEGFSEVRLRPADGMGPTMVQPVVTVNGHPGIFSIGSTADGRHLNGLDMKSTRLDECAAAPVACPVRTQDHPALLTVRLTGAEMFICNPCTNTNIIFELAAVTGVFVGPYQQQEVVTVINVGLGVEEAKIQLSTNLTGGEYRLRVKQKLRPEFAGPLTLLLGPPN